MQANERRDKGRLSYRQAFFCDPLAVESYRGLMRDAFEIESAETAGDPTWTPFGFFDGRRCVACVEAAVIKIVIDGRTTPLTALRRVAVSSDWRGNGLFRDLMEHAFVWCETQSEWATLLYTEDPSLYERLGFRIQPQSCFVGDAPIVERTEHLRLLHLGESRDRAIVHRLLASRRPVSDHCAIIEACDLALAAIAADDDLRLGYLADSDSLILHTIEDRHVTLVDVIGTRIPSMAAIVGALPFTPDMISTLFNPDRLAWTHRVVDDDPGLMARGRLPAGFDRFARLPPTAEF